MAENKLCESAAGGSNDVWTHVPQMLHYLRKWACDYGLRGLTVYFGEQPPLSTLATPEELVELRTAYETIVRREDAPAISEWCLSAPAKAIANDAREHIRGLLLLFESLAERGLLPFTDGRVRFLSPDPQPFDWSVLPPHLRPWKPWLTKFEDLRTEHDLYEYVQNASDDQFQELLDLKGLLDRNDQALMEWCDTNSKKGDPAEREAFQAGWLFLLADFASSGIPNESEEESN